MPVESVCLRDGRTVTVRQIVDAREYGLKLQQHGLLIPDDVIAQRLHGFQTALIEEYLVSPKLPACEFTAEEKALIVDAIAGRLGGREDAVEEPRDSYEAVVQEYRRRKHA